MKKKTKIFKLLKFGATEDMLYVANLTLGDDYTVESTKDGIEYYRIKVKTEEAKAIYECLKDLNIYVPQGGVYMSDYILMKKGIHITQGDLAFIDSFSIDALFTHTISQPKLIRIKRKMHGMKVMTAAST